MSSFFCFPLHFCCICLMTKLSFGDGHINHKSFNLYFWFSHPFHIILYIVYIYINLNPNLLHNMWYILFVYNWNLIVSIVLNLGSRSGNVTPGGHGHLSGSRPGSAMSTSTTLSTSGLVPRRPQTATRKPRPASIAGTGMSLEGMIRVTLYTFVCLANYLILAEINKLKRDINKPPVKTTNGNGNAAASPSTSTAQTTPKRTPNLMSTSMIVTSSSSRIHSAEKKTPSKRVS